MDASYKPGPGPWPVRADRFTLKDDKRKRNIAVTVKYPGGKAVHGHPPFPLIVFSHDAGSSPDSFAALTEYWASHGYVVIVPTHVDAIEHQRRRPSHRLAFDAVPLDRLADVVFVVDQLEHIERKMDGFHGRRRAGIDTDRIAIAGHATGALTAQMAIGVKVRVLGAGGEPELKSVADPRFKAALLISPQGTISRMLTRESWSDLSKPMMAITGSKDVVPDSRETPETRQDAFLLSKPGQKYLVFIEGATHAAFAASPGWTVGTSGGREGDEADPRLIGSVIASATLAFWDAYLLNDERAREYLSSDDIARMSGGKAVMKRR